MRAQVGDGFQITGLPVARAGPRYSIGMLKRKFHGVSTAHTPRG